jgi:aminopeptidase N
MKSHPSRLVLYSAGLLLTVAFSAVAQSPRADFNRPQTFDIQHYVIRASFDRANKRVLGDTTISLKPIAAELRQVELDAVDLKIESVKLEPGGAELTHQSSRTGVVINLDRSYAPADVVSVRIKYTATPKKGVYFVPAEKGRSAQIWTQGEPDEARHWLPSFDFPSDKATTEQILTVENGETAIGNGELVGRKKNENGTETWHYKMSVPHSLYLSSFVIGKYIRIDDKHKDIPIGFYVYPGREALARKAFGRTREIMQIFEERTGIPFPYNKYDQTIVAKFHFGGMENITATTLSDTDVFLADFSFGEALVTDLVSNELAHSWFGNLVTCRNWAELWLNEGLATFMEAAYRERAFDRASYMRKIRSDAEIFLVDDSVNKRRHALFNQRAADVGSLFDNSSTTYQKGAVVMHTLREQVGDEAFWKALNIYLIRHRLGSVETPDLIRAMEEASGQQLGWFFDQWVYGAGAPRLDVKQVYDPRSKTLNVTVSQTQPADTITPAVFRLPFEISVKNAEGDSKFEMDVTKRVESFSFKLTGKPLNLTIDPHDKIPLKRVKVRPLSVART